MAFDQPLEADRVGDLSLFSTLTRAPVIGALLWILGGDKAREEEEKARELVDNLLGGDGDNDTKPKSNRTTLKRNKIINDNQWKKSPPSLLGSEISVDECAGGGTLDGVGMVNHHSSSRSKIHSHGSVPKKQLSWSDECGKDLVDYGEKSAPKNPRPPQQAPVRSSMSRSRSVKNQMGTSTSENRYLPNSLIEKRNNMRAVAAENADGIESPQWGWYIRTTPPTPEMYYSSRSLNQKRNGSETSTSTNQSMEGASGVVPAPMPHSNPVFQGLQDRKKGPPMGWPSVPL